MKHGIMLLQNSTLPPRTKDFNGSLQQGIHHFHRFVNLISPSITRCYLESKGWRSGESTRLPPMWLGFKSQRRRHMWVEFVVGSLPCSKRFFSGYSGFPLSSKTNTSKFQFDQESGRRRTTLWMCYLQIIIYLFILLFYLSVPTTKASKSDFELQTESLP